MQKQKSKKINTWNKTQSRFIVNVLALALLNAKGILKYTCTSMSLMFSLHLFPFYSFNSNATERNFR